MSTSVSFDELRSALGAPEPPLLIDVRERPAFRAATDMITGALRRDPEAVGLWAGTLPSASTAVVYCAHGREVSQGVAKALNERGIESRYLEGGIDVWKTERGP